MADVYIIGRKKLTRQQYEDVENLCWNTKQFNFIDWVFFFSFRKWGSSKNSLRKYETKVFVNSIGKSNVCRSWKHPQCRKRWRHRCFPTLYEYLNGNAIIWETVNGMHLFLFLWKFWSFWNFVLERYVSKQLCLVLILPFIELGCQINCEDRNFSTKNFLFCHQQKDLNLHQSKRI